MAADTKQVQMRLKPSTLETVEELKVFFDTDNRTDIVARSIRLTSSIAKEMAAGSTIELRRKDGTIAFLMIT